MGHRLSSALVPLFDVDATLTFSITSRVSNIPMLTLAISELEDLLIHGKPAVKAGPKKDQEYDRSSYLSCVADTKAGFQKLYQFCFTLAKPECVIFLSFQ